MEVAAIGLEDEALLGPEEVHLDPAVDEVDGGVAARRRQPLLDQQRQHHRLQRALQPLLSRHGRGRVPLAQEQTQAGSPTPPRFERGLDRPDVEQPQRRRPLEGAAQRSQPDFAGEVDERSRRAGAGNPVVGSRLPKVRRPHRVPTDAVELSAPLFRRDHVDRHRCLVEEPHQRRRAAMRDHRAIAAGQHRGEHATASPGSRPTNRVDATEYRMQATDPDRVPDRAVAHAQPSKLGA
jgi:hypothetical protein